MLKHCALFISFLLFGILDVHAGADSCVGGLSEGKICNLSVGEKWREIAKKHKNVRTRKFATEGGGFAYKVFTGSNEVIAEVDRGYIFRITTMDVRLRTKKNIGLKNSALEIMKAYEKYRLVYGMADGAYCSIYIPELKCFFSFGIDSELSKKIETKTFQPEILYNVKPESYVCAKH